MRPCWILLLAIAVTACGGATRSAAPPAPEPAEKPAEKLEPLDDISQQMSVIRGWYGEIGPAQLRGLGPAPLPAGGAVCTEPPSRTCTDVCDLTDHVCEAARSVCEQAADLGGHSWADSKCDQARTMCRAARYECCACDGNGPSYPLIL